ncbi:MAG TPA: encapsulin-associated ferritin-like protein [Myxococcota bacterium]|nr:encapsulin-associated ferritin-like protein [Myxococcota bacterium]
MAENSLHEAPEDLSQATREMHRALLSLIEELEAVDWYAQRVDATQDEALARVLVHNLEEEKEHACMTLEWIRRRDPGFDQCLRQFLFTEGPIEESEEEEGESGSSNPKAGDWESGDRSSSGGRGLGLGGLK